MMLDFCRARVEFLCKQHDASACSARRALVYIGCLQESTQRTSVMIRNKARAERLLADNLKILWENAESPNYILQKEWVEVSARRAQDLRQVWQRHEDDSLQDDFKAYAGALETLCITCMESRDYAQGQRACAELRNAIRSAVQQLGPEWVCVPMVTRYSLCLCLCVCECVL
jgi:hypothetical protein